jgi:hypothetical protein
MRPTKSSSRAVTPASDNQGLRPWLCLAGLIRPERRVADESKRPILMPCGLLRFWGYVAQGR